MRTSVLFTVLAVALVVGGACKGADSPTETNTDHFLGVLRGANVIPPADDTLAGADVELAGGNSGAITLTYSNVTGFTTVDSIFLYTIAASAANYTVNAGTGATTWVAPSARVCGTTSGPTASGRDSTGVPTTAPGMVVSTHAAACAASVALAVRPDTVTTATTTTKNTATSLTSSLRAFGQQVVFFATSGTDKHKRGVFRGTPYFAP